MPGTWRGPKNVRPICPDCREDLAFVSVWTVRGTWGFNDVHTYECPTHGPLFITPEIAIETAFANVLEVDPDDRDREALTPARRTPKPTRGVDAIAVPEPDSD